MDLFNEWRRTQDGVLLSTMFCDHFTCDLIKNYSYIITHNNRTKHNPSRHRNTKSMNNPHHYIFFGILFERNPKYLFVKRDLQKENSSSSHVDELQQ